MDPHWLFCPYNEPRGAGSSNSRFLIEFVGLGPIDGPWPRAR